ncbi:BN860_08966g1_1 [Zygosaccharomyces bailii CLIB 213]|uniref:BN860_08966g1_1 n=1 Tax=Zygosaccharomyces bailii (strain CLIB 213 / ATCC 58445 / CBS 680 / BCRC 21525 / NBRC 1098 / NCYC 1416 / NRRL Y-2227) TaxID=1333698 RepID=A0A8J2SYQ9_ZYGB2|nr:BN860_08966g1_1 [Zygosaccharomyces bailii CLIB 213]
MNKDDPRTEKRRLRFSQEARDAILRDPLRDGSLLSRSSTSSARELQTSQQAREQLLLLLQSQKDRVLLEHGLRKLREIIVSVFQECKDDTNFLKLVHKTYNMSYDFFLEDRQFHKLGAVVLNFMATNFPCSPYRELYALHCSHVGSNLNECIKVLMGDPPSYKLDELHRQLILLSSIYVANMDSPSRWFQILMTLPTHLRKYLIAIPAYSHMRTRCLQHVRKCYNQISIDFLLKYWFHGMAIKSDIQHEWQAEVNCTSQMIVFRRRRGH